MLRYTTEVICDICGSALGIGKETELPRPEEIRRRAKEAGWHFKLGVSGIAYCPKCAAERRPPWK